MHMSHPRKRRRGQGSSYDREPTAAAAAVGESGDCKQQSAGAQRRRAALPAVPHHREQSSIEHARRVLAHGTRGDQHARRAGRDGHRDENTQSPGDGEMVAPLEQRAAVRQEKYPTRGAEGCGVEPGLHEHRRSIPDAEIHLSSRTPRGCGQRAPVRTTNENVPFTTWPSSTVSALHCTRYVAGASAGSATVTVDAPAVP